MIIEIPFLEEMKQKILSMEKYCTSRNKQYGMEYDYFKINDTIFCIYHIEKSTLRHVRDNLYKLEGVNSPDDFEKLWNKIHYKRLFKEEDEVYVHYFYRVK